MMRSLRIRFPELFGEIAKSKAQRKGLGVIQGRTAKWPGPVGPLAFRNRHASSGLGRSLGHGL